FAMICSALVKMFSFDLVFRCTRALFLTGLATCLIFCVLASASAQTGPPQITQQPADQYAFEGMTSRFSVVVVTGTPPVYLQWYKGPTLLPNQTNLMLTLTNIHFSDAGSYFVQVTNSVGTATSSNAVL